MARHAPPVTAFNNGEVSPYMYGRVDAEKYPLSLRECSNMVPLVQGPLRKRDGTRFISSTADEAAISRLLKFEFNPTQAYAVEVNGDRVRFFTLRGLLVELPLTVTARSTANPAVITSNGHGYSNGDQVVFTEVGSLTALANKVFVVASVTTNTFALTGFDGASLPALSGTVKVARVYSIDSPYTSTDLAELYPLQSADVLYIFHEDYAPRKLTRFGAVDWAFSTLALLDGPYLTMNTTGVTLTPGATSGSTTFTASSASAINDGDGFQTTDIGRHIRIQDAAGNWTWVEITARSSTTVVTGTIKGPALSSTAARTTWRLGLFSDTTGWPSCGAFFDDRLVLAGPTRYPHFIAGSKSGLYDNFEPTEADGTVTAANGFAYALVSRQVNKVNWMLDNERGLLLSTPAGEAVVGPAVSNEPFSALNIEVKWPTAYGSAPVVAERSEHAILFMQRANKRLREYAYVFEADNFRGANLSVMADHMAGSGIKRMAYQRHPQSSLWQVREDGLLIGFTYEREQNVFAWHRHPLGGTDASVEDVIVMSSPDGSDEDVWLIVSRTINGETRRYVEVIGDFFGHTTPQENAVFSDGALIYAGDPITTLTGLDYLEGQALQALVDGSQVTGLTVASGSIILPNAGSTIIAGLPYTARLWTLPHNYGSQDGTPQSKLKRVVALALRLYRSLGGLFGASTGDQNTIKYLSDGESAQAVPELFSGMTDPMDFPGGWERDGGWVIENTTPYPFTVTMAVPRVDTQDGG